MTFLKVLFFSIYFGLLADGRNWYLASDSGVNPNISKVNIFREELKTNTPPVTDNGFHKHVFRNYSPNNEFKPSNQSEVSFIIKNEETSKLVTKIGIRPKNASLELNNNIENTNIFNMNGPKRKKLRKCSEIRRKPKALISKATSEGRFLEVFEVVQFDHISCSSNTGFEGHCLHEYDCHKKGGTPMGTCADGYGTCCVILFNCEDRSSAPIGWLNNPGYPSPSTERLSCTFTLDIFSADIKQIRLDFMHFELLPPTVGNCELDQFLVTGHNVNNLIPILCGINTGHHVYIEVSNGPLILSIQTITAGNRLFSIKITQLTPSDELAAPTGCLQFFKEEHGHIESFNYRESTEIGIARSPSYLTNLNYAMCIERATASCSVTYTNSGAMQIVNYDTVESLYYELQFSPPDDLIFVMDLHGWRVTEATVYSRTKVHANEVADGLPVIPPQQAGVELLNCPSDWLLIAAIRLCGERLNDGSVLQDFSLDAPVTDNAAGPIVIWFRSDGVYTGRGFRIYYQQNPCTG